MLMFIFDRQAGNNTDHPSNSQGLAVPSELVLFAFFYLVSHFVPLYSSPTSWHNFIQRCVMPRRRLRLRRRLRRPHPYQRCASTSQKSPISLGPGYVSAIWLWNRNPRRSIVLKSKRSPRVACWSIASASVVFFFGFPMKSKANRSEKKKDQKENKTKRCQADIFEHILNSFQCQPNCEGSPLSPSSALTLFVSWFSLPLSKYARNFIHFLRLGRELRVWAWKD